MDRVEELKTFMSENTYFELVDQNKTTLMYETRDHGDVGEEEPGIKDIQEANRIISKIKETFPEFKCRKESVDEWMIIRIDIN